MITAPQTSPVSHVSHEVPQVNKNFHEMFGELCIADEDDADNAATDALFAARFGTKPITSTNIESSRSGSIHPSDNVSQSKLSDDDIANRWSPAPFGHHLPPKDYARLSSATEIKKDTTGDLNTESASVDVVQDSTTPQSDNMVKDSKIETSDHNNATSHLEPELNRLDHSPNRKVPVPDLATKMAVALSLIHI